MATISRIKPGQTLYHVAKQKAGNTTMHRTAVFAVHVSEVDPEGRFVLASWNGNPARKFRPNVVAKWRVSKPEGKL